MFELRKKNLLPLIVGHRGAKTYEPENTMRSFQAASNLGVDMIECDIHMSLDGHIMIIHDETTLRTTQKKGTVYEMTLAELKNLNAGKGEKIPTLNELLDWLLTQDQLKIAIEIKKGSDYYPGIINRSAQLVLERKLQDRALFISFDASAISEMKKTYPQLTTGFLYCSEKSVLNPIQLALDLGASVIGPSVRDLTIDEVSTAHTNGLGVFTWTANSLKDIKKAVLANVDAIASDAPDKIKQYLLAR